MINLPLTLTEASLVLSALRDVSGRVNMPQLETIIDNLNSAYLVAEQDSDEPFDGFRTDAEADADAHASAGYGTDEDYRPAQPAEDAHLDSYWEERNEGGHYYYNVWEDDGV